MPKHQAASYLAHLVCSQDYVIVCFQCTNSYASYASMGTGVCSYLKAPGRTHCNHCLQNLASSGTSHLQLHRLLEQSTASVTLQV